MIGCTHVVQSVSVDSVAGTDDNVGGRTVHAVTSYDHLSSRLEYRVYRWFTLDLVDTENCTAVIE